MEIDCETEMLSANIFVDERAAKNYAANCG